jgi:hypothetical protein
MAAALYLRKKCDGLTEAQKTKILAILEGVTDKDEIDRKFKVVLGTVMEQEEEEEDEEDEKKKDGENEEEEDDEEEDDKNESKKSRSELNLNEGEKSPFDEYIKMYTSVLKDGI